MEEKLIKECKKRVEKMVLFYPVLRNIDDLIEFSISLIKEIESNLRMIDLRKIDPTLLNSLELEIRKLKEIIKKEEGKYLERKERK